MGMMSIGKRYEKTQKDRETRTGLTAYAGKIENSEFDASDWETLLQDYYDMRKGDAIASTSLDILKLPIMQSEWNIIQANESDIAKEAKRYIEWCFEYMLTEWDSFMYHILLSFDYGAAFFEKIYESLVDYVDSEGKKKKTNIISRIVPFQLETIFEFMYKNGDFSGIMHERIDTDGGTEYIPIDANKLFWYSHNEEFGDVRGNSELRPVRLVFKIKQSILKSSARAKSRNAGIPEIKLGEGATESTQSKAKQIGRSIGNTDNGYIITNPDITFTLHALQNAESPEAYIEMLNREMFFNTLSEFMTSGIGGNGSRAATSEHKSAYELKANAVMKRIERALNSLIYEMIDISYLANIPYEDVPKFQFNSISRIDTQKIVSSIVQLYDRMLISKQDGDEEYFRDIFDLPEKKEIDITPRQVIDNIETTKLEKHYHRELNQTEREIFSLESANNTFESVQAEAEAIIDNIMSRIFADLAEKLEANPKADIDLLYRRELETKLTRLYESAREQGKGDYFDELKKIGYSKKSLATVPKSTRNNIEKWIDRLYLKIVNTVEDSIARVSDSFITKKGGMKDYILGIQTGFKTEKRQLITNTQAGYTDGRGDAIEATKDDVSEYMYSGILDRNICNNCAPLDGVTLTLQEARDAGLNITSPVNPDCLGRDQCRCQLIPVSLEV